MIQSKLQKTGNGFDEWVKKITEIDKAEVEVGHFEEQGLHRSKLTYPTLLALFHRGAVPNQPPRMILHALYMALNNLGSKEMAAIRNRWKKSGDARAALREVGEHIAKKEKRLFGVVGPYMPTDNSGTPLVETGDLRDRTAYRTTLDPKITEV